MYIEPVENCQAFLPARLFLLSLRPVSMHSPYKSGAGQEQLCWSHCVGAKSPPQFVCLCLPDAPRFQHAGNEAREPFLLTGGWMEPGPCLRETGVPVTKVSSCGDPGLAPQKKHLQENSSGYLSGGK